MKPLKAGKPVKIAVPCPGLTPGSAVALKVFEPHALGGDPVDTLSATVDAGGGVATATWTFEYAKYKDKIDAARFVFLVEGGGRTSVSPPVDFVDTFEATVKDAQGNPAANRQVVLHADRGKSVETRTDGRGKIKVDVPPGSYHVELTGQAPPLPEPPHAPPKAAPVAVAAVPVPAALPAGAGPSGSSGGGPSPFPAEAEESAPPPAKEGQLCGMVQLRSFKYLQPGGDFKAKEDPSGVLVTQPQPVENAEVRVVRGPQVGATSRPVRTDRHGIWDFGTVAAGQYEVEISGDGFKTTAVRDVPQADLTVYYINEIDPPKPSSRSMNLFHGEDVVRLVSGQLVPHNKLESFLAPSTLVTAIWGTISNKVQEVVTLGDNVSDDDATRFGSHYDANLDSPPPKVTAPCTIGYRNCSNVRRIYLSTGQGNCGEMARVASIECAQRGLHPVEVFALRDSELDGDHGFCVVGRDLTSDCRDARTWGPDAVIVDPWSKQCYPAAEVVDPKNMPCKHRNPPVLRLSELPVRW